MRIRCLLLVIAASLSPPAVACLGDRALFDQAFYISRSAQSFDNEKLAQQRALAALPESVAAILVHEQALSRLYETERALYNSMRDRFTQPDDAFVGVKDRLQTLDGAARQNAYGCLRLGARGQAAVSREAAQTVLENLNKKPEALHPSGRLGNARDITVDVLLAYLAADQQAEAAAVARLQAEKQILSLLSGDDSVGLNQIKRTIGLDSLKKIAAKCFQPHQSNQPFVNLTRALADLVPRPVPYDSRNVGFTAACILQTPNPAAILNLGKIEQQLAAAALSRNNADAFRFQQLRGRYASLSLHLNGLQAQELGLSRRLQLYQLDPDANADMLVSTRSLLQSTQRHRQQSQQMLAQIQGLLQQYGKSDNVQRWQRVRAQQQALATTLSATGFDSLKKTLALTPSHRLQLLQSYSKQAQVSLIPAGKTYAPDERTLAYLDGMRAFSALMQQRWQTLANALNRNSAQFVDNSYDALHCAIKVYVNEQLRSVRSECLSDQQKQHLADMESLLK